MLTEQEDFKRHLVFEAYVSKMVEVTYGSGGDNSDHEDDSNEGAKKLCLGS